MFGRLLWGLVRNSRGRLLVALVALTSAAAVLSALANVDLDVEKKLTQQFRTLGANLVVAPPRADQTPAPAAPNDSGAVSPVLMPESVADDLEKNRAPEIAALSPYLYVVARSQNDHSVVVVGAWLDQMPKLSHSWTVEGNWVQRRDDIERCIVGRNVARTFQVPAGGEIALSLPGHSARLAVAGIVEAGGAEDNQIFVNLPVAQSLAARPGKIELVQLSVTGTEKQMAAATRDLAAANPSLDVRPIRQIAAAEGQLLGRISAAVPNIFSPSRRASTAPTRNPMAPPMHASSTCSARKIAATRELGAPSAFISPTSERRSRTVVAAVAATANAAPISAARVTIHSKEETRDSTRPSVSATRRIGRASVPGITC